MEKITDKIAALPAGASYFSLEFFPPKTSMGSANLHARLERMSRGLRPLFVNVTWGAGGSTASKSLELADVCQRQMGLTTCLHLTCTNMSRRLIDNALAEAKALGIRNILALRGDPPRGEEYLSADGNGLNGNGHDNDEESELEWAIDLVRYIRRKYGDYFCIGVAAYPEGHADQSATATQDTTHDLPHLVEKVKAGADFIMTQLFFDVDRFLEFDRVLRSHPSGAFTSIPIIPGLMPIQSYHLLKRTTKLSHASLPGCLEQRLEPVKHDDEAVKEIGVEILSNIVHQIQQEPSVQPRGFHFYTLNLEKAVAFIIERCGLIPKPTNVSRSVTEHAIVDDEEAGPTLPTPPDHPDDCQNTIALPARRRPSSTHNAVITADSSASDLTAPRPASPHHISETLAGHLRSDSPLPRSTTLAISEGEGSLGREATWDDYPNGRWGDARSPAYGEIDGYGPTLHVSPAQATQMWGAPASDANISDLFVKHLQGAVEELPWSEGEDGLSEESRAIADELVHLNQKGYWTVASQPAVNCAASSDSVFGWGPRGGFVFQKAFVEFFVASERVKELLATLRQVSNDELTFFALSSGGEFETSDAEAVNAVTWGVFPGKEIITPTIIEAVSFRAWADEAFAKWNDWSRCYPPGSKAAQFLQRRAKGVWLVNVVCHEYVRPERLWEVLGVCQQK